MTATVVCGVESLLSLHKEPLPCVGDQIIIERERGIRKYYRVEKVLWYFRFMYAGHGKPPLTDHRIEIQVLQQV